MIAIVNYGIGNVESVQKALAQLGAETILTSDAEEIRRSEKIILPGVGAFGAGMQGLKERGLDAVLIAELDRAKPLLGICVGLQLLFEQSEEAPGVKGLGWFKGTVRRLRHLKIPHTGWNALRIDNRTRFAGIGEHPYFYFVHSYHAVPDDPSIIAATADYGERVTAAVARDNVFAVQFHPEKSGDVGLQLLKNFVWRA